MKRTETRTTIPVSLREQTTREDGEDLVIAGYFSVFDSNYELWPGATESVDRHAFDSSLGNDVRALINHDTSQVLGRTKTGTLKLSVDDRGLYGEIRINPNDRAAMDCYERVKRGDVDQCSFGFEILQEDTEYRQDGSVHWTIKDLNLFEVSVCTFPAYEDTCVNARKHDMQEIKKRSVQDFKARMLAKLKGDQDGVESAAS